MCLPMQKQRLRSARCSNALTTSRLDFAKVSEGHAIENELAFVINGCVVTLHDGNEGAQGPIERHKWWELIVEIGSSVAVDLKCQRRFLKLARSATKLRRDVLHARPRTLRGERHL